MTLFPRHSPQYAHTRSSSSCSRTSAIDGVSAGRSRRSRFVCRCIRWTVRFAQLMKRSSQMSHRYSGTEPLLAFPGELGLVVEPVAVVEDDVAPSGEARAARVAEEVAADARLHRADDVDLAEDVGDAEAAHVV